MTTGDVKNNLRKLLAELKQIRYPECNTNNDESVVRLDITALASGVPQAFLPILHFAFLDYSYALANYLAERDYELYAKTDLRFIAVVYRILRDEFSFKPQLTKEQFLSLGFAERKIILVSTILKLCRDKHFQLIPKENRLERKKAKHGAATSVRTNTSLKATSSGSAGESKSNQPKPKKSGGQSEVKFTQKIVKKPLFPSNLKLHSRSHATASTSREDACPATLLVNTEMNTFHSNEEALSKFGLSSSYPLVTREVQDDNNFAQVENKENQPGKCQYDCMDSTKVHGHMAEANVDKAVRYAAQSAGPTAATTASLKLHKSVRWEDELQSFDHSTSVSDATPLRDHFTAPPNLALFERISKQTVSAPVTMVTIPKPSPDLVLTPVSKANHMPIPLSVTCGQLSEHCSISKSLIDASGSDNIDQEYVQVIRHPHTPKVMVNMKSSGKLVGIATEKSDDGISDQRENASDNLVKCQLTEIQEKLDHVLSLNNHMSSRIVLLETRVKLLEEGQTSLLLSNCNSPSQLEGCQHLTLSGTIFQNSTEVNNFATQAQKGDVVYAKDINDLQMETPQVGNESDIVTISSDASENSLANSDEECANKTNSVQIHVPNKDQHESCHSRSVDAASILHTPRVSFVDSSTKATVLNVHKRLKETREMLTRTNKSFSARYSQLNSSETV